MNHTAFHRGRRGALAPAAALLLALCLLAVGVQAMTDPVDRPRSHGANDDAARPSLAHRSRPLSGQPPRAGAGLGRGLRRRRRGRRVPRHRAREPRRRVPRRPRASTSRTGTFHGRRLDPRRRVAHLHRERDRAAVRLPPARGREPGRDHQAGRHPGRRRSCRDGRRPADRFASTATTALRIDTLPAPRGRDRGPALVRRGLAGQPRHLDFELPSAEPTPVPTPAPELLVDTPGLHTLDRDLSADVIGVLINELRRRPRRHGPQHRGHGRERDGRLRLRAPHLGRRDHHERHRPEPHRPGLRRPGSAIGGVAGSVVEHVVAEQNRVGLTVNALRGHGDRPPRPRLGLPGEHRAGIDLGYPAEGIAIERCSITGNGVGVSAWTTSRSSDRTTNLLVDSDGLGERRRRHLDQRMTAAFWSSGTAPSATTAATA